MTAKAGGAQKVVWMLKRDGHELIVATDRFSYPFDAARVLGKQSTTLTVKASRFGFAYGTLPDHAGTGEERFLVEWDQSDNSVWYDILAFSRPNHFLTRLGYPLVRRTQRRFGRESSAAMQRAVS